MSTIGIVAEYNPFHNGHAYQIKKAKELTGADHVVIIMSGNYVQRGTPAIINKYTRAKHALLNGASLVIELPVCYATSSAELFAESAITALEKLKIVDYVAFGCECDDLSTLQKLATLLQNEPVEYKNSLKNYLSQGLSFPVARKKAVYETLQDDTIADILDTPNNILALEYLKAINRIASKLNPIPIKRIDSGYHSRNTDSDLASATAIRECLYNSDITTAQKLIPSNTSETYSKEIYLSLNDFSHSLASKLIYTENIEKYYDISHFLANRINNLKKEYVDYNSFVNSLLSKNETSTHIHRSLLHILLEIEHETIDTFKNQGVIFYANPLAINLNDSKLLKNIKKSSDIPLIERFGDFYKQQTSHIKQMLDINLKADELYNYHYLVKSSHRLPDDFSLSNTNKYLKL